MADRLIPAYLRRGRILDIGCGTFPLFLARTKFHEKFGADKVFQYLAHDHLEALGIRIAPFNIEQEDLMPFEDDRFDIVTMLAVLEHIEPSRLPGLLSEIYRILKSGGMLILTTPAAWTDKLLRLMAPIVLVSAVEMKDHKIAYTPSSLRTALSTGNFVPDKLEIGWFQSFFNIWARVVK